MGNTLRSIASMEGAPHVWDDHPGDNSTSRYAQYDRSNVRYWIALL